MIEDYKEVSLKVGLEIHQQLDTGKLFCRCPSIIRTDPPDVIIHRKLHAVAGESGEVDVAASYEAGREREFIYEGYSDTNCLLEYDESPPFEIDEEALKIALHISLLLNCEILPVTQIMRKTVLDGSNTSGFQRSVLIARNGYIDTESGRVGIWYVYLEEDAARTISEEEEGKIYKLDRLGIPLVEIVTAPDIKTPEQAKQVAMHIGDLLRSCKVKRGIGTIRQDINVSIPGHPRAEIKGFQDPNIFVEVVRKEAERQEEDLKNKKQSKAEVRGANPDASTKFLRPLPGSSRMYPETDLPLLRIKKEIIDEAKKTLPKLRSEIRGELTKKGLHEDQAKIILRDGKLEDFENLLKIIDDTKFIFKVLIEIPKEIASHEHIENIDEKITLDIIETIVSYVKEKKIEKSDVKHVIEEIAKGKSLEEAIKLEKIDLSDIEGEIAKLVKEKPGLNINAYMGLIMSKFKGKVSGKEAGEILQKLISK
jgi:Glu-tRNA(Gln) amidotransferase subunit E-like FAD-binding protein